MDITDVLEALEFDVEDIAWEVAGGEMIVKLTTEKSVFVEIDGRTYYIDHSLDEPIVEYWTEEQEPITLIEDDSNSED